MSGQTVGKNAPEVTNKVEQLAKTDHIALLKYCQEQFDGHFQDYTCTFIKQEKINGEIGKEQIIDVKFMEKPFSVVLAWTPETAPIGDRVIYVQGMYDDRMLVRPRLPQ